MKNLYNTLTSAIFIFIKVFFRLQVINKERLEDIENCILAANHISLLDPPFIGAILPKEIHYLAKSELFKNKIFGKFLKSVNAIPVKRGMIDKSAIKNVQNVLQLGHSILIFPQGTRNGTSIKAGIGKFAIQMKIEIVPIYIENSNKFWKCLFGKERLKIYIGKRIKLEDFVDWEENRNNYRKLANLVFQKVKELKK